MRGEGDRFVDAWRLDASATTGSGFEDEQVERALLAYAQRSAARVGAEWFAAEFARREEQERLDRERAEMRSAIVHEPSPVALPEIELVDASVEDDVVGGAPTGLGIAPPPQPEPEPEPPEPEPPQPAMRHPHVPRPPAPEPTPEPKRRRRRRKAVQAPAPSFVISAPEWARMSPGARRLYGLDAAPPATGTG